MQYSDDMGYGCACTFWAAAVVAAQGLGRQDGAG